MDYDDKFKEKISLDVDDAIGVCNDLLNVNTLTKIRRNK